MSVVDIMSIFDDLETGTKTLFLKPKVHFPEVKEILETILQDKTQIGPWVAGGMGRQIAVGETTFNDIDIWFNSSRQFHEVKERLFSKYEKCTLQVYDTDNAETCYVGNQKLQLIKRQWFNSIEHVFEHFDFSCCQIAVNEDLSLYGPGIDDAKNYVLKTKRVDTKTFLARYGKYVSYGYKMDPEEFLNTINENEVAYEFDGSTFGY